MVGGAMRKLSLAVMPVLAVLSMVTASAPLRAETPPPLSVYGKLPGVERVAISPSGDLIAMIGVVEGARRLVVVDQDKKPLFAYPVDDTKVRGLFWAGNDRVLLYMSNTTKLDAGFIGDKAELFSMVVIPLDGEKMWSVFGHDEKITGGVTGFFGIQQHDGRYYGYFGGLTFSGDFRSPQGYLTNGGPVLYQVDLQNQQATAIAQRFEGLGGYRDWVMGPDGKVGATLDYTSRTGAWAIHNAAGQKIAEGIDPLGNIDLVGLAATTGSMIYSEEAKDKEVHWFEIPLTGGAPKEILADVALDGAFFDQKSRQLVGYREVGDVPAYRFFDGYRQKVINATMKAFPGLLVHLVDWSDRFDRLVVMTEGADDPQTWWTVDIKTGQAGELGFSYPMDRADVGPVRMITYKAGDGTEIAGVLTLPPGRQPKNLPVVIFPHGGPAARDYPGFDWWAQALASRGYAVLQPNFRGSTGYGAAFQHAGDGQWGRRMQSDISDGLAYLASQGIVDPKRACIMGGSYGGYAALAGVTLQHGLYRCAVAVAGVSDVAKMAASDIHQSDYDPTMKRAIEAAIGVHQDLRPISPINFAAQADAPILLIHGKDDTVVSYDQSNDMAAALRAAGKPVELVTLPAEDHLLSRSETRLMMLEATVRFIEAHNPPDPAPWPIEARSGSQAACLEISIPIYAINDSIYGD